MPTPHQKVVFVNRYYAPDHSATSQLLTDLTAHLVTRGLDVEVVTSRMLYEDPDRRLPASETIRGVRVSRVWTTRFGRQNLWGRTLDYLSFYLSALVFLLRHVRRGDIVVAKTDPPMISVIAAFVCRIKGARLVNWIQDLFPEVARALQARGIEALHGPLRFVRNLSLRAAETNVTIGSTMSRRLREQGVDPGTVREIHNWSIDENTVPLAAERNPLRSEWGLTDTFVVGYSGNVGRAHDIDTLIDAAASLADRDDIRFLIIGGGALYAHAQERVEALRLGNVVFEPYQPVERLQYSLTLPDVHIISLLPELEGLIVPSKFYGIAAAGRPTVFIGSPDGEIAGLLREGECGRSIGIGEGGRLAQLLQELRDDPEHVRAMGRRARSLFEARYTRTLAFESWEQVLSARSADRPG